MEGDKMEMGLNEKRKDVSEKLVPAGLESNLLSKKRKKPLPTENMYSDATKIYSPMSRGF